MSDFFFLWTHTILAGVVEQNLFRPCYFSKWSPWWCNARGAPPQLILSTWRTKAGQLVPVGSEERFVVEPCSGPVPQVQSPEARCGTCGVKGDLFSNMPWMLQKKCRAWPLLSSTADRYCRREVGSEGRRTTTIQTESDSTNVGWIQSRLGDGTHRR